MLSKSVAIELAVVVVWPIFRLMYEEPGLDNFAPGGLGHG
jgi:hypothetical protein